MLFRSFSVIAAVLLAASSPSVVTGSSRILSSSAGAIVEEQDTGVLHIHLLPELIERVKKDASAHHQNVLAHFLTGGEIGSDDSEDGRALKKAKAAKANKKTTKSSKSSRLSAECRNDELTYEALCQFIVYGLFFVLDSKFFDYYIDYYTNTTGCDVVGDSLICDLSLAPEDEGIGFGFDFNATQCVDDYGGQVLNTTTTYDVLSNNITDFTLKNMPYCIPTSCDPKTFVEFATDMNSMKLPEGSLKNRRRKLQEGCFLR